MRIRPMRIYADTSVFGGVFDQGFDEASQALFAEVRAHRFRLVMSPLVLRESLGSPEWVRALVAEIAPLADIAEPSDESLDLQQAYLEASIVSPGSADDALHVALATVAGCVMIVSWNFKHIVHANKIPLYNAVNARQGFPPIAIYSPAEVIDYEEEDF